MSAPPRRAVPPRSPARQSLADAIARHHKVAQSLDALKASRARAADACAAAAQVVETKKEALEAARQDHVDRIESGLSAGVNTATAPALNVRAARTAVMEAEDDLATLREALARFDDRLAGSPSQGTASEAAVDDGECTQNATFRPHRGLQPRFAANVSPVVFGARPFDPWSGRQKMSSKRQACRRP